MKIGLIDPALYTHAGVTSPNIGDQVISRAVHRELRRIFGEGTDIVAIPSHEYPDRRALAAIAGADHVFVGGSNLLYFRWWRPTSWKIGPRGLAGYRDLILLGTGWGAYEIKPNRYGRWVSNLILSRRHRHSVRDGFTQGIVRRALDIPNVVNTACPTMWCLSPERLASIHRHRGDECIFALTDYARDPASDAQLIKDLQRLYAGKLLFWPQGTGDLAYCRSLGYDGPVLERSLDALLAVLRAGTVFDYIGTRLHAGILCLEHRVRSLVVSVDNRAQEIAADTALPTIRRGDRAGLSAWAEEAPPTIVRLPVEAIEGWRSQFVPPSASVRAA